MSEVYSHDHMDSRLRRTQERALQAHGREVIAKQVEIYLGRSAAKLRNEGVPLTADGDARIDMTSFRNKVVPEGDIARDQAEIAKIRQQWKDERALLGQKEKDDGDKKLRQGERLEMLKTALFQKYLERDFIVARSSEYDDVKNGIDNVIVDRRGGNLVCAFDEVGEESGSVFEKKKNRVITKNAQGGARLKYGFSISNNRVTLGAINNIPIFYLAMSPAKIEEALQSFDGQSQSGPDRVVFRAFLDLILSQVRELLAPGAQVSPTIQDKVRKTSLALQKYK